MKRDFSPLDQQLELWDKSWSPELCKQLVWLGGKAHSFMEAEETLARIGRLSVSDSSVWRQVKKWGAHFQQMEEKSINQGEQPLNKEERQQKARRSGEDKGVAMDGAMICIRGEGWKELKVGCVFDIDVRPTKDKETGQWADQAHAVNNQYVAHLGGPERLGQMVWGLARRQAWFGAAKRIALGDGASWIWNLADYHFPQSKQMLDWYHATEHLSDVAQLLYGEDEKQREQWLDQQKEKLFAGKGEEIAEHLVEQAIAESPSVAEELQTEAGYFADNHKRMAYQAMEAEGYPIGSGMVESGCKQFKMRFDGPGMRWSREGAERLLPIRATVMGGRFDAVWSQAYYPPPN